MSTVGENIKKYRTQQKKSQEDMAQSLNVTRQTVNGTTQTSVVLTAWSGTNSVQITLYEADPQESIRYVAPILEEVLDRLED